MGPPDAISASLCLCLHSDVSWPPTSQDQKRAHSLQRPVALSQEQESHALQREVPLQLQVCGHAGVFCFYSPSRIIGGVLTVCCLICSACDRKPASGFKPETPPSTPVSPRGPTSTAGTHPLSERIPPPHPHVANPSPGRRPVHLRQPTQGSAGSPEQPVQGHSPPFVVPCASINQHASTLTSEHR